MHQIVLDLNKMYICNLCSLCKWYFWEKWWSVILTLDQYVQKSNLPGITRVQTCQVSLKFVDISKMKYADRKAQTPIMCSFMPLCKECLNMLLAIVFLFISVYVFLFLWLIIQYKIYWVKWCGPDKGKGFDLFVSWP